MKFDLKVATDLLKDFAIKHDLKKVAIAHCITAMKNCLEDDADGLEGFCIDDIKLQFKNHHLIFEGGFFVCPIVKTHIGLYKKETDDVYFGNHEQIGYYQLDTNLDGEHVDDWLIINVKKED